MPPPPPFLHTHIYRHMLHRDTTCTPPHTPPLLPPGQSQQRISCPTCRARVLVSEADYVSDGRVPLTTVGGEEDAGSREEAGIAVRGSYSTKVGAGGWAGWVGG
jgi:hypothetical protein